MGFYVTKNVCLRFFGIKDLKRPCLCLLIVYCENCALIVPAINCVTNKLKYNADITSKIHSRKKKQKLKGVCYDVYVCKKSD